MPQPLPNLHHLELFYHVAKSGGITAAVRQMPYGIQQPAVSGQISQLEKELGVRLFQRRPFQLTPAGQELFEFAAPFFGGLAGVAERVAGKASRHLRLAAPATVVREHLPAVLSEVRAACPELELTVLDAGQQAVLELLEREELDLAVTELEGRPPVGSQCEVFLSLPLVLLLPPGCPVPQGGLSALVASQPLIRTPDETALSRSFARGLAKVGCHWPARISVNTMELVQAYVAGGFGVGLGVNLPGAELPEGVTMFPLPDFPELKIAALWRGKPGPIAKAVLEGLRRRAEALSGS
ncbi:DNA-binding transcriptional LysR family regulator [Haloferula luteola]|uniref:DNA-binding transcriptional LysR family regulator n=1 Tax=Haloferula luteola TaxID=595692 RepID=A0A840VGU5_9BACT|nr:LysR family transcriptional regulator [Haloferula luteola]MBB5353050.1 DNA-binding transcriptional LysR family regulator [Haloferula luteola]